MFNRGFLFLIIFASLVVLCCCLCFRLRQHLEGLNRPIPSSSSLPMVSLPEYATEGGRTTSPSPPSSTEPPPYTTATQTVQPLPSRPTQPYPFLQPHPYGQPYQWSQYPGPYAPGMAPSMGMGGMGMGGGGYGWGSLAGAGIGGLLLGEMLGGGLGGMGQGGGYGLNGGQFDTSTEDVYTMDDSGGDGGDGI